MTPSDRLRMAHVAVEGAARRISEAICAPACMWADLRAALLVLDKAQTANGSPLWSALEQADAGRVVNPKRSAEDAELYPDNPNATSDDGCNNVACGHARQSHHDVDMLPGCNFPECPCEEFVE